MAKKRRLQLHLSDNVKAGILRWWLVGMSYYMVAFGTQLGARDDPLDLIFFLGVGIGLVTVVVYNPIAYNAFDIVRRGEIVNKARKNRSGAAKARDNLIEIVLSLCVVVLVYLTYQGVNELLVRMLEREEGTVIVLGEPFGFATLYILFYSALMGIAGQAWDAWKKTKSQGEHNEEAHRDGT